MSSREIKFIVSNFSFLCNVFLKGVWLEIIDFRFFHVSVSPGTLNIPRGHFIFLQKNRVHIRNFEKLLPVSLLLALNYCGCRWSRWLSFVPDFHRFLQQNLKKYKKASCIKKICIYRRCRWRRCLTCSFEYLSEFS